MKKLNEALEMLSALVGMYNDNETINKNTWKHAEQIVLRHKNELQEPLIKKN